MKPIKNIMKTIVTLLIVLTSLATFSSAAYAQSYAGEDSARYYKSTPERYEAKYVDVDCIFVTRINGGPQIDGVTFFAAHTKDSDNRAFGGSIVVAVLTDKAESFVRKYGDTLDLQRGAAEKVDSKRLRGIFHQLEQGHVYIDYSGGAAHELILKQIEAAKHAIRSGDGPLGANEKGLGKMRKF